MSSTRIIGHDEWVGSKTSILLVSFRRRYIKWNLDLEKLVYHAFASRNRIVQSSEITQLVSCLLVHVVVVVIHIDRICVPQSLPPDVVILLVGCTWPAFM